VGEACLLQIPVLNALLGFIKTMPQLLHREFHYVEMVKRLDLRNATMAILLMVMDVMETARALKQDGYDQEVLPLLLTLVLFVLPDSTKTMPQILKLEYLIVEMVSEQAQRNVTTITLRMEMDAKVTAQLLKPAGYDREDLLLQ